MQQSTKDLIERAGISMEDPNIELPDVLKLNKEMKKIILNVPRVSKDEVRMIVNLYYDVQKIRVGVSEQIRSIEKGFSGKGSQSNDANVLILQWILANIAATEKGIKDILHWVCQSDPVGRWLEQITGIGPVLGAAMLAYFDISKAPYASHFISYAGLNDNNRPWLGREKAKKIIADVLEENHPGEKRVTITQEDVELISARTQWKVGYLQKKAYDEEKGKWDKSKLEKACAMTPYNADLKKIMFLVGKSFEYQKSNPKSVYGRLLSERIAAEKSKNENGDYQQLIEQHLAEKNYGKTTKTYASYMEGKLPDPEINARCRRWVEKIFISHVFEEMYRSTYGKLPPRYYALEHCEGHHNEIEPEVPYDLADDSVTC